MYTLFLYNTVTGTSEVEYVTDSWYKMFSAYWELMCEELANSVTSDGQLLAKIDWWENEFSLPDGLQPETFIYYDNELQKYRFRMSDTTLDVIFHNDLYSNHQSPLMRLIHTNTNSATTNPDKALFICDSGNADYLKVMRQPLRKQNPNEPHHHATV